MSIRISSNIAAELANSSIEPIIIASHPRSGTHLAIDLLRKQFRSCNSWKFPGEKLSCLYISLEALFEPTAPSPVSERRALGVLQRCRRPLIKTHLILDQIPSGQCTEAGQLGRHWIDFLQRKATLIYVHRDVREVLCSYHLLKIGRDPHLYGPMSLSDFIRYKDSTGRNPVEAWVSHVRCYLENPKVTMVAFRRLTMGTRRLLEEIGALIGDDPRFREPLLPGKYGSIWSSRWARLCRLRPECTAVLGRPRGRSLAKWELVFSREDRRFIHEQAGEILMRLGYVSSESWVKG